METHQKQEGNRSNLYHRVVGALVLIALAVIFVPMVLDFRKDYGRVITGTNIPEKPDEYQIKEVPLNPPSSIPPPAAEAAAEDAPSSEPAAKTPETRGNRKPLPENTGSGDGGDAPVDGWVVQVGSFSDQENAAALRDKLQAEGYSAYVDRVTVEGAAVWRVGVGPVAEESRGNRLREELARKLDLHGLVRRYKNDDPGR